MKKQMQIRKLLSALLAMVMTFSAFLTTGIPAGLSANAAETTLTFNAIETVNISESNPSEHVFEKDGVMGQQFSNGEYFLRFDATEVGEYVVFDLEVPEAGEYEFSIRYRAHESCGYAEMYLNDEDIGEFNNDLPGPNTMNTAEIDTVTLNQGVNKLKFVITKPSTNPSDSRIYFLNIFDFIFVREGDIGPDPEILPGNSTDKIEVYSFPSCYTKSTLYTVEADGIDVPVYAATGDYDYVHFSMKKGPVTVKVTTTDSSTSCSISPLSLGLTATRSGSTFTFAVSENQYLILKLSNSNKRLVILIDPPENDKPASTGDGIFNVVTDFGAVGNNRTVNTEALQAAIDAASDYGTENQTSGIVYVPAGVYLTGTLALKSNCSLYLEGGSVLRATGKSKDYIKRGYKSSIGKPVTTLIYTYNNLIEDPYSEDFLKPENYVVSENMKIYGRGTLDANGTVMETKGLLMQTLCAYNCKNFTLDGITCLDSNIWSIIPGYSEDLTFTNMKILNSLSMHENDCIDVNGCKNVLIKNAIGIALDDPFSTKTYKGSSQNDMFTGLIDTQSPNDNVVFEDLLSWTVCYGLKVGQGTYYDHKNVVFRNSTVYDCAVGIGIHHKYGNGSVYDITFENITIENCSFTNGGGGTVNGFKDSHRTWVHIEAKSPSASTDVYPIHDVTIRDITVLNKGTTGGKIVGSSEAEAGQGDTIDGITFSRIKMPESTTFGSTLAALNVTITSRATNLTVDNDPAFSPGNVNTKSATLSSHDTSAFLSTRSASDGKFDLRLTVVTERQHLITGDTVKVTFTDANGANTVKTYVIGKDLTLQSEVTAAGVTYMADDGSLIYGIIFPDNGKNSFASVKVEILRDGNILADGTLSYSELG